ncbi:MAG: MMPL family transporter [Solirubrobacteraceae bacterium]
MLALATVFLVVAFAFGGPVAGLLSTGDDFSDPGAESVAAVQRIERATGVDAGPWVIALVRPPGGEVTGPAGMRETARVAAALRSVPGVARTVSYADGRDRAFVSRDGDATYVVAFLRSGTDGDDAAEKVKDRLEGRPGVTLGGRGLAGPTVGEQVSEDLAKAELLAFPLLFLLSLWVFRGVVAALLPLFVGLFTVMGTFLALRLVNEVELLSIYALNLATALGLGLAIDYSLFMVSRYREEMAAGAEPRVALARTMSTAGRTILFSSLTVAAAMLSLLVFPQRFLYSMGISGALVALIGAVVALTALPALLMVLGRRVNALAPRRWQRREADGDEHGFWHSVSRGVMRRPLPIALVTAALLVALGLPFTGIKFTGVDASVLPDGSSPKVVDQALKAQFPPGRDEPVSVAVAAPRSAGPRVEAYAQRLGGLDGAAQVAPPRFLGRDTWQVQVFSEKPVLDGGSLDLVRAARDVTPPGPALVGGESAVFVDQQTAIGDRLPVALAILAMTTLVILFALTGSVILPIKALLMNVLTLSAAFGLLVLVFQDGRLEGPLDYTSQGAIESTQPLVLLALAFGLSTDYGVFLLTRIKEARDAGASNDDAVAIGLQRTGRIVTAAALLFSIALGAFATSEIIFIKEVGLGTVAAVLIDATIVRALLVPSLMALLGEWNWWAPQPLRRLHGRIRMREAAVPVD